MECVLPIESPIWSLITTQDWLVMQLAHEGIGQFLKDHNNAYSHPNCLASSVLESSFPVSK